MLSFFYLIWFFGRFFYLKPILAIIVMTVIVVNITHLRHKYTSRRHYPYYAKTLSVHGGVHISSLRRRVSRVGVFFLCGGSAFLPTPIKE